MPTISVVIPVHNAGLTLGRALDSVLIQREVDFEVIVVNDRSLDDSAEIARRHDVTPIVISSRHPGAAAARNEGIAKSKGEYVAFLDADDYWLPEKLWRQLQALDSHPSAGICGCFAVMQDASGCLVGGKNAYSGHAKILSLPELIKRPYLGTPGVIARRELLMNLGGFREHLKTAEDVDLWVRAGIASQIVLVDLALFVICRSTTSLTATAGDQCFQDNLGILDELRADPALASEQLQRAVRVSRAQVLCDWGSAALCRNDVPTARGHLLASIKTAPTTRAMYLLAKTLRTGRALRAIP